MRLSRLRLRNIRRFTDPVDVAGIGPGLNILAAPNESGKSTLLDALHAVIALKHRSKSPVERALQPYQGGAPEVVLSLETDALGAVEIRKRWLSAPLAEIRGAQGLVAQGDAAEDWIAAEIGGANDMPALLWVRQGGSGLDGEFGDASLRRGLAASAAAEIEAAGGGETLEALARDLEAARAPYVTSTGRSKTGGPLKRAEDAL
ncbi:MAG: AAA family ATPase, partial [Pseudomonadota bacterium]